MEDRNELQAMLRFLSQDAKIPLVEAIRKIQDLKAIKLVTITQIAEADIDKVSAVFVDKKVARQVLNAAKRVSKKRSASESAGTDLVRSPVKKAKPSHGEAVDPASYEASLALPEVDADEERLRHYVVFTNRAPLVLAFAVTLLKYTMPEQPISSRLSLAQAVCSANSQSKAKSIGLRNDKSAKEEGWGEGQPVISVMGRDISVMKRWGYSWKEDSTESTQNTIKAETPAPSEQNAAESQKVVEEASGGTLDQSEPALWGIDLEALKRSNGPLAFDTRRTLADSLPIHKPEPTRTYMLSSFHNKPTDTDAKPPSKKKAIEDKLQNLGMLLEALDRLCASWSTVLSKKDLDRRAWGWYVAIRPDVKDGIAGWGGKGNIALADILKLRRSPD